MIQATGEPYKTEKCIKLIFSLMQKTTLTRGFWNAFPVPSSCALTISIDHIRVNEHFNTVNSCTSSIATAPAN